MLRIHRYEPIFSLSLSR